MFNWILLRFRIFIPNSKSHLIFFCLHCDTLARDADQSLTVTSHITMHSALFPLQDAGVVFWDDRQGHDYLTEDAVPGCRQRFTPSEDQKLIARAKRYGAWVL
jgi:hypothetical protein